MASETVLQAMRTEVQTDPQGRGYSGMTDQEAADDLNLERITLERESFASAELFEAIDLTEWQALSATEREQLNMVMDRGEGIMVSTGKNARDWLIDLFGAGSATRASIIALVQYSVSRAQELGFTRLVTAGDVTSWR